MDNDQGLTTISPEPAGRLDEQRKAALETARTFVPLRSMRPNFLSELFARVVVEELAPGQELFHQGEHDQQVIYLLHGLLRLERDNAVSFVDAATTNTPIANKQPRPLTAVAETACGVLRIDADELDRLLCWSQVADYLLAEIGSRRELDEDVTWMQTILSSNLFFKVPPVNVENIFSRLEAQLVRTGETIVRQGELGDCCYFIKEGSAQVVLRDEKTQQINKLVNLFPGRCFGEDALVNDAPRNASVTMLSDGVLMRLHKQDFELLLKEPISDEISEEEIEKLLDVPIYLDSRTEEEYRLGHISFSGNMPLGLLGIKKRLLSQEKLYLFYCDTGRRSRAAAYLLGKLGYNTMMLKGGLNAAIDDDILVSEPGYILRGGELAAVE